MEMFPIRRLYVPDPPIYGRACLINMKKRRDGRVGLWKAFAIGGSGTGLGSGVDAGMPLAHEAIKGFLVILGLRGGVGEP